MIAFCKSKIDIKWSEFGLGIVFLRQITILHNSIFIITNIYKTRHCQLLKVLFGHYTFILKVFRFFIAEFTLSRLLHKLLIINKYYLSIQNFK